MQELANDLVKAAHPLNLGTQEQEKILRQAAVKWSEACLNVLDGSTLNLGLGISVAIVNFLNDLELDRKGLKRD